MMLLPQQLTSPNILNLVLLFQLFIALSLGIDSSPRNCYVFTYVHPQDVTPCVQFSHYYDKITDQQQTQEEAG